MALNHIGDLGVDALGEALSSNDVLQVLGLEGNRVGVDGVAELLEGLSQNRRLQELRLSGNDAALEDPNAALQHGSAFFLKPSFPASLQEGIVEIVDGGMPGDTDMGTTAAAPEAAAAAAATRSNTTAVANDTNSATYEPMAPLAAVSV